MLQLARFDTPGPFALPMHRSDATGRPLLKLGDFGADLIHFEAGGRVEMHTHPGDHILFALAGRGVVVYEGTPHDLEPGVCYLIPGSAPHAVYAAADTPLTLAVVGNRHIPVDCVARLDPADG